MIKKAVRVNEVGKKTNCKHGRDNYSRQTI